MKHKILFLSGIFIFLLMIFLNFHISLAQEKVLEVYRDKKNYFTVTPPAGWTKEEIVTDTVSQVNFRSPDGKAGLGIIAQHDGGEINNLFSQKKDYVKEFQRRFPKGKFSLSWDTLGQYKVILVNFEIPQLIKQKQYFFFDQGIRFDLVYGVGNFADFEKYNQIALSAFATVQGPKIPQKK